MRNNNTSRFALIITVLFFSFGLYAQEEIVFSPADLIPHNDGYYIAGVSVDEDQDGNFEFHNKCDDYYEDDASDGFYDPRVNHQETGEQQDFKYVECMIMPTCEAKADTPTVSTGYIQLHACLYSNTDSASYSYIQTPPVSNLQSIYMETSSDVSINDSRQIPYNIEYSKDGGTTWENTYFGDNVEKQGGYTVTYDGSINLEIKEMIDASKEGTIVLRIITNDRAIDGAQQGQFVKLHYLKLIAEKASHAQQVQVTNLKLRTKNRAIESETNKIEVYNIMGQFVGTGNLVEVPTQGIYLIKTENGPAQKILVK